MGYDPKGRDGIRLSEYWADGMRTMHGIHVHGFPNLFIVQPTQGANLISNVPHNLTESGKTIAMIVRHALDTGADQVEVTAEAEQAWLDLLLTGPGTIFNNPDCTPGYYNNEGHPNDKTAQWMRGYPAGRDGVLPVHRRVALERPLRGPRVPLTRSPASQRPFAHNVRTPRRQ